MKQNFAYWLSLVLIVAALVLTGCSFSAGDLSENNLENIIWSVSEITFSELADSDFSYSFPYINSYDDTLNVYFYLQDSIVYAFQDIYVDSSDENRITKNT